MRARATRASEWEELIAAARGAAANAYAPYSKLRVGAALEAADGEVHTGCNVENASLGLTVCAERVALACAVAQGRREFTRLAIYTPDAGPLAPCGACRQVLEEFCRRLEIVSVGRDGVPREFELAELLPQAFGWPTDVRAAGEDANEQEA
jgi:cytidine deaminase